MKEIELSCEQTTQKSKANATTPILERLGQ